MTTGFLVTNDQCFEVCTCSYQSYIDCGSRCLQAFPVFDLSAGSLPTSHVNVQLERNTLTEIPYRAFANFTLFPRHNSIRMQISLNQNHISHIRDGAFLGLENVSLELYLDDNRLTSISPEFTRLTGLQVLHIQKNPLSVIGIPDDVIKQMFYNNAITEISLGSYELLKKAMKYQQNTIRTLDIYDINETRFDRGLFVKRHTTELKYLSIYSSAFGDFSEVLCNLGLSRLYLYMCWNVNDTTLQGCPQNNTDNLAIEFCAITKAFDPSAFYSAPVMRLELSGDIDSVPRTLLRHWPNLNSVDLDGHIHIIQKEDFEGLTELKRLSISAHDNITFVDDEAFNANLKLSYLALSPYGSLARLSSSIKNLTLLQQLYLPNMTCSCATIGALKGGYYQSVDITGQCKNIPGKSIKAYVTNDISSCL